MDKPIIARSCNSKYPCHNHIDCDRCARIRQSKIARTIHQPASEQPCRTWQVYKVEQDTHLKTALGQLSRAMNGKVAGGMWTLEYGHKGMGLHINLLTASENSPNPVNIKGLTYRWQSNISQVDSGFIAAYITKREQLPPREIYQGRTIAMFGDWRGREAKPLREYLITIGVSCQKIGDIFATAALNQKSLSFALINTAALINIIKKAAPEVMTAYEHEQSRLHAAGAIAALKAVNARQAAQRLNASS
jgi:hypothetical protein